MLIEFIHNPTDEDIEFVLNGLRAFNKPHLPSEDIRKIACFARDEDGSLAGGLIGDLFSNTLYIQYLWVEGENRHSGLGSNLIAKVEAEVKAQGATHLYLDTFSFQAEGFYRKLGFEVVGRYKGFPTKGVDKIFLQKQIV